MQPTNLQSEHIKDETTMIVINNLQSNQVKHTPQDYINEFIIWILNPLFISRMQ